MMRLFGVRFPKKRAVLGFPLPRDARELDTGSVHHANGHISWTKYWSRKSVSELVGWYESRIADTQDLSHETNTWQRKKGRRTTTLEIRKDDSFPGSSDAAPPQAASIIFVSSNTSRKR